MLSNAIVLTLQIKYYPLISYIYKYLGNTVVVL